MWLFHCHIDWHMVMGMAVVFDVASETIGKYPNDYPLCGSAVKRAAEDAELCKSQLESETYSDNDEVYEYGNLGFGGVIAVCVVVTFFGTICIVFAGLYFFGTRYVPTLAAAENKPLSSSSIDRAEAELPSM